VKAKTSAPPVEKARTKPKRARATPTPRRTPSEARRVILDAAQRLLAEHGPDAVGLKEVAKEAGVSHALVSHYFGTYEALVEAALADHLTRLRVDGLARMARIPGASPAAWLDLAFEHLAHPLSGRLLVWAMLTGRLEREDFVVLRDRGLSQVVDAIEARLAQGKRSVDRATLESSVLIGFCAAIGYSLGRGPLWGSLGRRASAERDRRFRSDLSQLLLGLVPGLADEK
jgi:TetR/AcrR family transcriptional regulator, repressor for neighboring sulfatase